MTENQKNLPDLSIKLDSGSTAIIPRRVDLQERENTHYGKKWHRIVDLLDQVQDHVDLGIEYSSPEDVSVGKGVLELLQVAALDDRSSLFHQDVDALLKKVDEEKWEAPKLGLHLAIIASSYGMDYEELTQELTKRRLVSYGIRSIPLGHFSFENDNTANIDLLYFTNIEIVSTDNDLKIEMTPVYDGGIDSIAYPVHEAKITFSRERPIDVNIAILFLRSHELAKEIWKHDEVISFLKTSLVGIMHRFATDRQGFSDERKGNSRGKDNTVFEDELFDFMEKDYLKKKLDNTQYQQFRQRLKYIDSDNASGVVSLKAIAENILDDKSYLRTGYYAKNAAQDLNAIVEKTKTALESLGCKIEDGVFTNFYEIVDKAAKDHKFASKINALWQSIFTGGDKILVGMMKDDVRRWAYLYWIDLHSSTFQKALEAARGVVILNGSVN